MLQLEAQETFPLILKEGDAKDGELPHRSSAPFRICGLRARLGTEPTRPRTRPPGWPVSMRITAVRIQNFRGIRSLDVELGPVTVLIGENHTGKTSVLDALKLCLRDLGPRRRTVFDTLDYHLTDSEAEPSSTDPIEIELAFSDHADDEWDDGLVGRLNRARVLQIDDKGRNHVRLRVTSRYDRSGGEFVHEWSFLDLKGDSLRGVTLRALTVLQEELHYHYLRALRDAARHFDARGRFWKPFLTDSQLSPDRKAEIEAKLQEVNDLVVSSHASFEQVQAGLRQVRTPPGAVRCADGYGRSRLHRGRTQPNVRHALEGSGATRDDDGRKDPLGTTR